MESALNANELAGWTRSDLESWLARLPGDPAGTLIAELSGTVVGLLTPAREQVIVARDHRRAGIASRLVEQAEALSANRDEGVLSLSLPHGSTVAETFLRALGFSYHSSLWQMRLSPEISVEQPQFTHGVFTRSFRNDDVTGFVELFNEAFADHPSPLSLTVEMAQHVHALPEFDPNDLLLAFSPGPPNQAIGLCRVLIKPGDQGTTGHVGTIAVRPTWQGRGLGRALLRWAVHHARQRGAGEMTLAVEGNNARARRLYEQEGFVLAEEWPRWSRQNRHLDSAKKSIQQISCNPSQWCVLCDAIHTPPSLYAGTNQTDHSVVSKTKLPREGGGMSNGTQGRGQEW